VRVLLAGCLAFGVASSGCVVTTTEVYLNPELPPGIRSASIPGKIALRIDDEFRGYRWERYCGAELTTLKYDLGAAFSSTLKRALKKATKEIVVFEGKVPSAKGDSSDADLTVVPSIVSFDETHPGVSRKGDYSTTIEWRLVAYDPKGLRVLDETFVSRGLAPGKARRKLARNFAVPAEIAVQKAVQLAVERIRALRVSGER